MAVETYKQEVDIVRTIKGAIKKNASNPITIQAGRTKIHGVTGSSMIDGNYVDIVFYTQDDELNISLKGSRESSLEGGGLKGLENVDPVITSKFLSTSFRYLSRVKKLNLGDPVPEICGRISQSDKNKLVVGVGPSYQKIDYMFVVPNFITSAYNPRRNILTFMGSQLMTASEYSHSKQLYYRLRATESDQRFDPEAIQNGMPSIYGSSPSTGVSGGTIDIIDRPPTNADIVSII